MKVDAAEDLALLKAEGRSATFPVTGRFAVGRDFLQRQPLHPRFPEDLPTTDPFRQHPPANLAPCFPISIHASWFMKMPHV